ncbi:hypothetical protein C0Q70_06099 [Pomacea canaliculata]|uniref:Cytochrome P450 n=1 Tax=Pomacea canaliculata TaxID=400727 RepID=A0A2T7PN24_POMCA|nr:hypothetical protein C0Q70_06099 [Pomacea canaliculata]
MPSPVLIINDLDLIKDVAIKQFQSFPNRQIPNIFKVKPWNANLLSVRGDQWKHVRGILSPTFSSGKLKKMVPAVQRVVSNLVNNVTEKAKTGEMIELKEFCGWFAMDVIAGVVFGLQRFSDFLQLLVEAEKEQEAQQEKPADYSTANELVYLDMCLNEALRMFPPGFYTMRESIEDTEVGGYKVPKGMRAIFPFYAIHIDPEIWPNPTKYDPERHTPEARATRHPCSFLPFGIGPRNCIGMRLAQLELRMALAAVLQRVTPVLCEKSVYPPKSFEFGRITSTDGVWVKFQLRD